MTIAGKMEEIILVQEREELMMSSLSCGRPVVRIAHFLTPSDNSTEDGSAAFHLPPPNPVSCSDSNFKESLIKINFCRWKNPQNSWKEWVDLMYSKHQMLWKKAGIFDAVLNSKYTIHRDDELLHAFAARWCSKTNTFVFPWGEATLTLEDMMMFGGYSVLGEPVFSPLENQEMKKIERKLEHARSEFSKSRSKKAGHGAWLGKFMNSGNEIEHEAFLVYWLSRFVFPLAEDSIVKRLFPIAVHLAKGTKIALAPSVLASIYSDLNAYKKTTHNILVSSQFNLILIWVWERFSILRPNPTIVTSEEPTFARWHNLRRNGGGIITNSIEKAADSFEWRPCTKTTVGESLLPSKIKGGQEHCLSVTSGKEEVEAMIRCLRVSELVGVDTNCIEQYLPHRVARQFGLDQDIPAVVKRPNSNHHLAWKNYTRTINHKRFCIPSSVLESNVTIRYLKWWNKSMSTEDGVCKGFTINRPEQSHVSSTGNLIGLGHKIKTAAAELNIPPGFLPKQKVMPGSTQISSSKLENGMKESLRKAAAEFDVPPGFPPKFQSEEQQQQDHTEDVVCEGFIDRMTYEESKKQKLLDSARKKSVDQVSAPAGNALKENLDFSSENSKIGGIETDLKRSLGFGNGLSYKRLMNDGVCEGFVDRMTYEESKKQKLLDSARKRPVDQALALAGNALKENSDFSSENSKIGGSETDLKHSRVFCNGVSYKRLMKGMALKPAANKSDGDASSVPPIYPSKCNTAIARSSYAKDVRMESICPQAMKSKALGIPSKEVSSKAFVEKISNHATQNEGKSIPCVSKDSRIELEARIFNLETIRARYKSDRGLV